MSSIPTLPRISELVSYLFPPAVRDRGREYARKNRVSVRDHSPTHVSASVAGTRRYNVTIRLAPELSKSMMSCTCPYFTDRGPCKHIWAAILVAEKLGYLSMDGWIDAEEDLLDDDDWQYEDDDDGEDEDESDADGHDSAVVPFKTARAQWRYLIQDLQQDARRPPRTGIPATIRIRYVLDVDSTLRNSRGINIKIQAQRRRKNANGWTLFSPLALDPEDVSGLDDPIDRQITAVLAGPAADPAIPSYYSHMRKKSEFTISHALAEHLFPILAGAGRFCLSTQAFEDRDGDSLQFDSGPPWRFELDVARRAPGKGCDITGVLTRGDERIKLTEPALLLASGWVFTPRSIARLDHGDTFPWIAALRRDGAIHVPESELGALVPELLKCRVRPPITLPDELQWREHRCPPAPIVRIRRSTQRTHGQFLGASVAFAYDDTEFAASDSRESVFDPNSKLLLVRDTAAEAALLESLTGHGFRPPRYPHIPAYFHPVHREILNRDLPNAVRALLAAGWHVEAEGVKCRASGSISVSVRSSGIDWFDVDGVVHFDDATVSFPTVLAALRTGETMIRLDDGTSGVLPEEWLKRYRLLAKAGTESGDGIRFARSQAVFLDALLAQQENVSCDEIFAKVREELRTFTSIAPAEAPHGFQGKLRAYQKDGLGWLAFLHRFGFGGCLADDMGLGKTVQALAMLESERQAGRGASLAVVPKSIVMNWVSEAARFTPNLSVLDHTGTARVRDAAQFSDYDLIITTYGIVRQDIEWLKDHRFNWVILDEAQAVKNAGTATAKSARLLQGGYRLAMSGTPIENHLGELWSLFEFLNPGMLGSSSVFSELSGSGNVDEDGRLRDLLGRALRPFILRRTKDQVAADLPAKVEETILCELPGAQRKLYDELKEYYRKSLKATVDEKGLNRSKIVVLEALLRLRQAACHPGLLDKSKRRQSSAKLDLLLEQIDDVVQEGHKMLIFSQFTSMLAIVRSRLDARGIVYEYLDGQTQKRAAHVERFQTDPDCPLFLISLKAGGLGLNLTAADYVVLLDPWWNPAVEAQAIDRAHRIGQTRKVLAYRLVAKDTVEERILELQKTKKQLADSIITADNSLIRNLKREDLDLLLS